MSQNCLFGSRCKTCEARPRCRWAVAGGPTLRASTMPTRLEEVAKPARPDHDAGGRQAEPDWASRRRAEPHVSTPGAAGVEGVGGAGGRERAWLRCPWAVAGPGRASRRRAGRSSRRGRLAGGPPPTGTPSSPAQQAPGTPVGPQQQAPHQRAQAYKNRHPDRMSACGGARGIRTPDLLIANETRYQLRHSPKDSSSLAPWPAPTQADHRRVRESTKPQARQQFHVPTGPATARAGVR